MSKNKKFQYFEIALYIVVAVIVLFIPLFIRYEEGGEWGFVFRDWLRLIPFFVVFFINNFFLAPKFFLKGKYGFYALSCALLIVIAVFLSNLNDKRDFRKPDQWAKSEMTLPENNQAHFKNLHEGDHPQDMGHFQNDKPHFNAPYKGVPPPFLKFGTFIISFLVIGFNSGIKIFVRWANEQDERNEKERQYLTTELAFLKHQISPHFFMNTLNNIHALVDIDTERAKDAIIKLSRLMRYLLYESDADKTSLKKEMEFLESYIELMRMRYDESKLSINLKYTGYSEQIAVPSLLFLPLVENSFKHGVNTREKSFVNINFTVEDNHLILIVQNSNHVKKSSVFDENSGIGLENIRKRLDIIYKKNYVLTLKSENDIFEVSLTIPVE